MGTHAAWAGPMTFGSGSEFDGHDVIHPDLGSAVTSGPREGPGRPALPSRASRRAAGPKARFEPRGVAFRLRSARTTHSPRAQAGQLRDRRLEDAVFSLERAQGRGLHAHVQPSLRTRSSRPTELKSVAVGPCRTRV
ncbi:hypothetical protein Ssi02_29120 [Sinosporangium siamense]|uniref:Uncharacterized protein n=1 Tax=Sinosporangium siamense TaxID=1367973 RepID=A0A919RIM5_9ACTN|nr:hypothetical protein Ssi02_29120 [Sinosporangium siamense]